MERARPCQAGLGEALHCHVEGLLRAVDLLLEQVVLVALAAQLHHALLLPLHRLQDVLFAARADPLTRTHRSGDAPRAKG